MAERIGCVGLGRMGSRMVGRLLDRGYDLIVHDVRPDAVESLLERGIAVAGTPVDLARQAQVVLVSLPTPASVEAVVLGREGLPGGFEPGSLFIDLSTTGIEVERRIAAELGRRGIQPWPTRWRRTTTPRRSSAGPSSMSGTSLATRAWPRRTSRPS
jgi:3-hydroxyisobutyrate dehydrogenase-like beta-hydroxyacid dehydrogenase